MSSETENGLAIPVARELYVLMKNDYRISRNIRAQWFLNHLNKDLLITPKFSKNDCTKEIEVISAVPKTGPACLGENGESFTVRIVPETKVIFLASCYRLVFCLDLSSSIATVEVQHGTLFFDEVYPSLKQSLEKVCQPFNVPGSQFNYIPQLHITIIAHIPNCPSGVPQVIVQGWILTADNVSSLLKKIKNSLPKVSQRVAKSVSKLNKESLRLKVSTSNNNSVSSSLNGSFDSAKLMKAVPHSLPADISTLNLLRYGILALQLLPENSSAGIIVITDGILIFPNTQMQDSLLAQLRNSTISCSFLQIGSPYHPFTCIGRVPYRELMQFISAATCGAYFPSPLDLNFLQKLGEPNAYHEAFLFWSFNTTRIPDFFKPYEPPSYVAEKDKTFWAVENPYFHCVANQSRVRKKHITGSLKVSFENILSCRLREGYTVKSVTVDEGKGIIDMKLLLPWNLSTNFEYIITSNLHSSVPSQSSNMDVQVPNTFYELIVDGCYEFLHDVTCSIKKPITSSYRADVIKQFWTYVKNLSHTDQILIKLHSFSHNPVHYTLPESIKNGIPLFCISPNSTTPILLSENMANSQFTTFWKPLCMLDINVWQKWMHTHRIGIILQHDVPLPKNLHLPNTSGRYLHIQCRQASTILSTLLNNYCTFVLVENQFYIRFLYNDADKPPTSFYVIRVSSKGPCVVIRLAFLGGLPGFERNKIVKELRDMICNLKLPKRAAASKDTRLSDEPSPSAMCDINCCYNLKKPVEKILIRYEWLPKNFMASIVESQLNTQRGLVGRLVSDHVIMNMLITLSKYLHHQRWVWSLQSAPNSSLTLSVASKILSILTKIRLKQGFHFSHSSLGIINMVLEIPMKVSLNHFDTEADTLNNTELSPCVVQYLLFPPHTNTTLKDSVSEDEDSELPEADGELQLITECWVEPQYGAVCADTNLKHLNGITYEEIARAFFVEDLEIISVLTTFEHLSMCCHNNENGTCSYGAPASRNLSAASSIRNDQTLQSLSSVLHVPPPTKPLSALLDGSDIYFVPYCFNVAKMLSKCHQSEFLFPTLCQDESRVLNSDLAAQSNELLTEFLVNNIKHVHDRELLLKDEDFLGFILQVHHRNCSHHHNSSNVPFPHPLMCSSFSNTFKEFQVSHCLRCVQNNEATNLESCNQSVDENEYEIPKWRCFIKTVSLTHFIITLIPADYNELKKLQSLPLQRVSKDADLKDNPNEDPGSNSQEQIQRKLIPVYMYDCVLSSINSSFISLNDEPRLPDNFASFKFKYEEDSFAPESTAAGLSEPLSNEVELLIHDKAANAILGSYHSVVDKLFCKSFVYSVYRSLVLDLDVDKYDVTAAIDEICEESFLEVDITDFVYSVCGHIKDFTTKHSLCQVHLQSSEKIDDGEKDTTKEFSSPSSAFTTPELTTSRSFPLSLLQRHQPCEHLRLKHLDIKDKFSEILNGYLKKIPSRPDYYVFYPSQDDDEPSLHEEPFIEDEQIVPTSPIVQFGENDPVSTDQEDILSLESRRNIQSSFSSFEADSESSISKNKLQWPPLFIHLLCSLKSKHDIKSCSISSLPTCFGDLLECLNSKSSEVDLDGFRITLDVTCLTLFSDIETSTLVKERQCSMSFSSASPVPDPYRYEMGPENEDDSSSENLSDTVSHGPLHNVPQFQKENIYKCIDKIKWLLMDEKASASLDSYPITSDILSMVCTHVSNSKEKPSCITKEVPLKFVFGPEPSVEEFIKVLKQLTLPGYRLNEIESFYYLVLDGDSINKQHHPFGSLNPPLGFASKFLLMHKSAHCNDITTLNAISNETPNPLPYVLNECDYSSTVVEHSVGDSDAKSLDCSQPTPKKVFLSSVPRFKKRVFKPISARTQRIYKHSLTDIKKALHPLRRSYSCSQLSTKCPSGIFRASSVPTNIHLCQGKNERHRHLSFSSAFLMESKSSPSDLLHLSQNKLHEWSSEIPSSSPVWGFQKTQNNFSISSGPSSIKCKLVDSADSPQIFSDADYASVFGSSHFSNTEDGYEGGSSDDSCSDFDWKCALDSKRPVLPNFWLIMSVDSSRVTIYFHIRHCDKEDSNLKQSMEILDHIVKIITDICKEVNQMLLLQSLHETRKCNQLLVAEESDDIWKKDSDISPSDPYRMFNEDENMFGEEQDKYLEANLRFMPGIFSCGVVWSTHFRLHHRLYYKHSASHVSKGIQALRTVLNTFAVSNRENMFVYQEGSVFYIRLYEEICEADHSFNKFKTEDLMSPSGSCCSFVQNASQPICHENENEGDFRPRANSGHSDVDRQDSLSNFSTSKNPQKCIALYVHGIGEVGTEMKDNLVKALQKKLNEAVLDMIIMMLTRNPLCKLTPEDVQFIQNPNQPPCSEIHFTIPVRLLCHAHSIHMYLRQNLLNFVYNPKYTDNKKENHFKAYSKRHFEWTHVDDSDMFLYVSFQAPAYTGNKDIACIVLSLVNGQGNSFHHLNNPAPNPTAYQDGLSENDFEEFTSTICGASKKTRAPGPVALIRFQVWTVGICSLQNMEQNLLNAVRHSLWDLLMEFRILTAPITESLVHDDFSCVSEPTTPVRARRTGRINVVHGLRETSLTLALQTSKDISSSVPDIAAACDVSKPSLQESLFHVNRPQSAKFYATLPKDEESAPLVNPKFPNVDKLNLNPIFHSVMRSFLHYGNNLGCPALSKHIFSLTSRHSIPIVIREVLNIIKGTMRDLNTRVFLRSTNMLNSDIEFVPYRAGSDEPAEDSHDLNPGNKKSYIIISRNEQQWNSYMGNSDFLKFHETHTEAIKNYQRFQTHLCKPSTSEIHTESMPASPTVLSQPISVSSPKAKNIGFPNLDANSTQIVPAFVPRQRLLLLHIEDKEVTVYIYNWSIDVTSNFLKQLSKLIQWHECRDSLVNNVVFQKLGLFHGQSFVKKSNKMKPDASGRKKSEAPTMVTWTVAEQLFQLHSPPRDCPGVSSAGRPTNVRSAPTVMHILKNTRPPIPMHHSKYSSLSDHVRKYGMQLQDIIKAQRRDMQELHAMWQARNNTGHTPFVNRMLVLVHRMARFSHYCLTPILFSPSWRWKVAPIRDHTIQPSDFFAALEKSPSDSSSLNRSRHDSGNSVKNFDGTSVGNSSRSRRTSGAAPQNLSHSSPKFRVKYPSEETWHHTACNHYLLEYIQYLHTLGFVSLQTRETPVHHSAKKSMTAEDIKHAKMSSTSLSRSSIVSPPVFYLIKYQLGGLLLFEVGLSDPYAYAYLYTIEYTRLHPQNLRVLGSQFTSAFLDEVDKIKALMHLHSFTFDYHLRTIHSYISGRQLIFRHGYHLTSFLGDFIKYYQKAPNCARNLLYAGSVVVTDINMPDYQLYNYIISHNQLYGMTVLRMVPITYENNLMMETEYVLVELSACKATYKDMNDQCQIGSFDIGILINHNTADINAENSISLNYYIILTSQRELFPKLTNFGTTFGSFQTVRLPSLQTPSAYPSRKTSTVSMLDKDKLETSGEDSLSSSNDSNKFKKITSVMGITDEEVTYLGYFSSQETLMQKVLMTEANNAQKHLKGVFIRASVHCKRDFLWSSLLPRAVKEDEGTGKDFHTSMSCVEFMELLNLVSSVPLDDIDENLRPFMNMHISWYKALSSVLKVKYGDLCREYRDQDQNITFVVVTHIKCPDVFMLLSINAHEQKGELCLVFRDVDQCVKPDTGKPSDRMLSHQVMVEEFVNACCFQMWSSIMN